MEVRNDGINGIILMQEMCFKKMTEEFYLCDIFCATWSQTKVTKFESTRVVYMHELWLNHYRHPKNVTSLWHMFRE